MRGVCVVLLILGTSRGIQLAPVEQTTDRRLLPRLPRLPPLPQLPRLQHLQERVRKVIEAPRNRWITAASEARTESGGDAVAFVKLLTGVDGWTLKFEKGNVRVWARQVAGSKFKEVRGNGIVDAPPAKVLALLRASDAETIRQYNPMYASGYDLQQLDPNTKVSYGTARKVGPMKPRDTVTRVAFRELPSGGTVLMLRAVDHSEKPVASKYVRARILRGMHLVQPVHGAAGKTNFTFTQQVDCGGAVPAWLMNILITQDAVQFIDRIGKVARERRPSTPSVAAPPTVPAGGDDPPRQPVTDHKGQLVMAVAASS
jgi:hypothetical protein